MLQWTQQAEDTPRMAGCRASICMGSSMSACMSMSCAGRDEAREQQLSHLPFRCAATSYIHAPMLLHEYPTPMLMLSKSHTGQPTCWQPWASICLPPATERARPSRSCHWRGVLGCCQAQRSPCSCTAGGRVHAAEQVPSLPVPHDRARNCCRQPWGSIAVPLASAERHQWLALTHKDKTSTWAKQAAPREASAFFATPVWW
jgi:hypothetical protein